MYSYETKESYLKLVFTKQKKASPMMKSDIKERYSQTVCTFEQSPNFSFINLPMKGRVNYFFLFLGSTRSG